MSVSILKVKNPTTGEWKEIPTIVGPTGPAGPQGEEGAQGETGPAGKNAYEYAQERGYAGTEEEFANKLAKDNILYVDFTDNGDGTYQASKNVIEVQAAHAAEIDIKARITYDGMPLIVPIFLIGETFVGYGGASDNMTIYILHQGVAAQITVKELALQDDMNSIADAVNEIDLLLGNNVPVIDNAKTGQIVSIASVDENNAPNGWQAIDLPSGGRTPQLIRTFELAEGEEVNSIVLDTCDDGTSFADAGWRKVGVKATVQGPADLEDYTHAFLRVNTVPLSSGYGKLTRLLHKTARRNYFTVEASGSTMVVSYYSDYSHYTQENRINVYYDIISVTSDDYMGDRVTSINIYNMDYVMSYGTKIEVWGIE